jgi:hypothetical protein
MKIKVKDDMIIIGNVEHIFENTINTIIILDNMILVHLLKEERNKTDMSKQTVNNVYAFTLEGDILWNIFDIIGEEHCITDIYIDDNNQLVAFSFFSIRFKIDLMKKIIVEKVSTK